MLFVAIFIAPWWGVFILSLVGIFHFNFYYEALALGFLFDILYGTGGSYSLGYGVVGFVVMIVSFISIGWLKKELR